MTDTVRRRDRLDPLLKMELKKHAEKGLKSYCENAIKNNINELHDRTSGFSPMRECVIHLSEIDGINEKIPKLMLDTTLSDQPKDKSITLDLNTEYVGTLDDVGDATGVSHSEIRRTCYLLQLNNDLEFAQNRESHYQRIQQKCDSIKDELAEIKVRFHGTLFKLFVMRAEGTQRRIEQDINQFKMFADVYVPDFHGTEAYDVMLQEFDDRAFIATENIIEMHTDYTFQNKESFLEN